MANLRLHLYDEARKQGLMEEGDQPVKRLKRATGKLVLKHVEDIRSVVRSIRNNQPIDRVLLKNGKRSLQKLKKSQEAVVATDFVQILSAENGISVEQISAQGLSCAPIDNSGFVSGVDSAAPYMSLFSDPMITDATFRSTVIKEIRMISAP